MNDYMVLFFKLIDKTLPMSFCLQVNLFCELFFGGVASNYKTF